MSAAPGGERDVAQAFRAGFGLWRLGFSGAELFEQRVERKHNKEIDGRGYQQELNQGVQEVLRFIFTKYGASLTPQRY